MASGLSERIARGARSARNRVGSLTQAAAKQFPLHAALASIVFTGLDRLGARVWGSRAGRVSLVALAGVLVLIEPAAAQVGCSSGPLSFLSDLHSIVTQSVGTIVISMVLLAGALKMIPARGTSSWGNALIGSILVGIVFLVVGPALVDLADQSTDVNLDAQCTGGSSSSGGDT